MDLKEAVIQIANEIELGTTTKIQYFLKKVGPDPEKDRRF